MKELHEIAKTHVRIHGRDKYLISMDFDAEPELIISTLAKLQGDINRGDI